MAPATPHHLLNTSWTLHRLSPLHHEKEFATLSSPTALKTYASRLQDQLTGNTLGGLQTGGIASGAVADDEALSRTGALKSCTWETLPSLSFLSEPQTQSRSNRRQPKQQPGILVTLEYENIVYKAALLAPPPTTGSPTPDRKGSTHLPLLLTRLPGPLRQTFVSFLAANFDTYCSALRFPSHFMCAGLEAYVNGMITEDDDRAAQRQSILEDVVKEMQITLSFSSSIAPELRSLNVNIPRGSFADFVETETSRADGSILSNLSSYLEKHLAMKLDLSAESDKGHSPAKEHVRVSRIACGGFLLGGDGKLKLVAVQKMIPGADDEELVGGEVGSETGEKARLMLRANEALLLAVMRRVASVDEQGV
ncbi:uncharacterized protein BDW47DRAFT_22777 [Aspergillus candidus]|uniref:Kinetochore complex Sim4 subunit Fta1-domain-containing protein n=1 Tax=Aspergillus candidus TaxID=41067 RepID=A0A2I2FCS4_ASPCN|nr:kinetochore complex Sim4 subunit Fta1-domain-containing protein [Aspergillus candidus]PLB38435.1 kinetochore complex Sim4 subunit Fta1-domain-containing protein [Aspergillus candidus]